MTKHRNHVALDPGEFWLAVELGIRAGQKRPPVIEQSDPDTHTPHPLAQAGYVLGDIYGLDTVEFESAMSRFAALMLLFSQGVLGEWVKSSDDKPDSSDIHPAVIDVAARMRLSDNGKFPVKKFLAAISETAKRKYPDVPGWHASRLVDCCARDA